VQRFQRRQIRVLLCGLHSDLRNTVELAGITALVGERHICSDMNEVAARVAGN
jgi:hypothetical protein